MKTIKKSIFGILFSICFLSCDDFLDLSPISEETSDVAYETLSQIEAALTGTYESFQSEYYVWDNVIFQDNKSAMLMEKNGRTSCTGNSRHINVQYFFIKDLIDKKEVKGKYLPTNLMIADYFTKPLNGSRFRILREFIMGWRPMSDLKHIKMNDGV